MRRHPRPRAAPTLVHPSTRIAVAAAFAMAAAPVAAQNAPQQVVRGPVSTYWITADTSAGLAAMGQQATGGIGSMLGMLTGRAPSSVRSLDLRLGSSQPASGAPQAAHLIPPGMAMGPQLPLVTPEPVRAPAAEPQDRTVPQGMEQPKGRLLVFWGCGEKAGPGQPLILDFAKIGSGQPMPNMVSRSVRQPRGPAFGSSRTFGAWPNERDRQPVPAQASLRGEHQVKGNYSPDIRFMVEQQDFMAPVELTSGTTTGGAQQLDWKAVGGATGYFMAAFGANAEGGGAGGGTDMVMWTSSAVQETGGSLMDHVPPPEVARLIRERVVLPPDRTQCHVPAEVLKAMPMGMLSFIAYGDELNVSFPPRPQDPKVPWDIQWAVKLRLKSTSMTPLGEGMSGMMGASRGAPPSAQPAAGSATAPGTTPASGPAPTGAAEGSGSGMPGSAQEAVEQGVREGARVLRGLFGR